MEPDEETPDDRRAYWNSVGRGNRRDGQRFYRAYPVQMTRLVAMSRNTLRSWFALGAR